MKRQITQEARDRLADQIAAQGPSLANLANNVRTGFENFWLTPALRAIDHALDPDRPDAED